MFFQMAFCSLAVREHDHRDCLLRRSPHPLCLVHLCPANPCLCHSLRGATCLRSCLALLVTIIECNNLFKTRECITEKE